MAQKMAHKQPIKSFRLFLPCNPHSEEEATIRIDGEDVEGITDVTVRAGANGLTNVVMQFDARAAIDTVAMAIAKVPLEDTEGEDTLERIYDQAIQEAVGSDHPGSVIVRRIVELLLERLS